MRYLLIDGNNMVHRAASMKKLTVGQTEVTAIYHFLRTIRAMAANHASARLLVLWDGASWRNMGFPDYKQNRDKEDTPAARKQKAARDTAKKQIKPIQKALTLIGIDQLKAMNMEADDLAAIMVEKCEARGDTALLVSGDQDWIQLVSPRVTWWDPINGRKVSPKTLEEFSGVKDTKQFVEMKALMGDLGDNIPGVGGIGKKGAVEFLNTYGSVVEFTNQYLDGTLDITKLPKKFQNLCSDEGKMIIFNRNIDLMDLRTKERPAPVNLRVMRGEPDMERFELFCEKLVFQSILSNLDNWLSIFPAFRHLMEEAA